MKLLKNIRQSIFQEIKTRFGALRTKHRELIDSLNKMKNPVMDQNAPSKNTVLKKNDCGENRENEGNEGDQVGHSAHCTIDQRLLTSLSSPMDLLAIMVFNAFVFCIEYYTIQTETSTPNGAATPPLTSNAVEEPVTMPDEPNGDEHLPGTDT